ncbi:hypothetical protein [Neobacillus dielmonensis]|uniref:hypothetical protein n=1 Tax=Neobacillus dielmonensis TaxID=1347369 RepID=UPI0005AA71AB|nr:hypothetical protein [Neobacillus dielmonensis]
MRHLILTIILVCSILLTSCNSLKVPKSMMDHKMSAVPVDVVPTNAEWKVPEHVNPSEKIPLSILIKDNSNQPITSFETVHEKKMHLFIISNDLSYFSHIHPKYKENGQFDFTGEFPAGGDYKLIAEFTPKGGGDSSVETHWLQVEGEPADFGPIVPDKKLTKKVNGKEVTLSFDQLQPNKILHMTFSIRDAKIHKPIKDLQPYLGAMGHAVAISADAEQYLHIHPMTTEENGPKVTFMTIFPEKGLYKIWGQFKHDGKVFTVPFVIEVH